jgi:hypothetical protein
MPIVHRLPTGATVKELYGTALVCAFPGCEEPLFRENPGGAGQSLNSRLAHIAARSEGGPRWDALMTEVDNRSAANLFLMCLRHAAEIDELGWELRFPADLMLTWKADQVAAYDAAVSVGWQLSDEEVDEVLQASAIDSTIVLQAQNIMVGGTGGSASGASGGGGGAIGPGAVGGPGGPVGRIDLEGTPGEAPGAGGGGGGLLAPGAIMRDPEAPRASEGKGFSAGVDGQDGGDTMIMAGESVLLRARGGRRGLAGTGDRVTSDRLAVSALMLADYVEAGGLVYMARGCWQNYSVLNLPAKSFLPVLVVIEAGGVPPGEYTLILEAMGPDGTSQSQMSFPVTVEEAGDILRISRSCGLEVTFDAFGLWTIIAKTPVAELARLDLLVKRTGEA